MTSTRLPALDGKNSSKTKISLEEMFDLQQNRTAYDEYYRKMAYVPDDFPIQKVLEKNVKKWALCGIYTSDTTREGYGNNNKKINVQTVHHFHNSHNYQNFLNFVIEGH